MATTTQMNLIIEEYSPKAFVIRGDTKPVKEEMKNMGGKWNPRLKGGPAWVFSNKRKAEAEEWLAKRKCTIATEDESQEETKEEQAKYGVILFPETKKYNFQNIPKHTTFETKQIDGSCYLFDWDVERFARHLKEVNHDEFKDFKIRIANDIRVEKRRCQDGRIVEDRYHSPETATFTLEYNCFWDRDSSSHIVTQLLERQERWINISPILEAWETHQKLTLERVGELDKTFQLIVDLELDPHKVSSKLADLDLRDFVWDKAYNFTDFFSKHEVDQHWFCSLSPVQQWQEYVHIHYDRDEIIEYVMNDWKKTKKELTYELEQDHDPDTVAWWKKTKNVSDQQMRNIFSDALDQNIQLYREIKKLNERRNYFEMERFEGIDIESMELYYELCDKLYFQINAQVCPDFGKPCDGRCYGCKQGERFDGTYINCTGYMLNGVPAWELTGVLDNLYNWAY